MENVPYVKGNRIVYGHVCCTATCRFRSLLPGNEKTYKVLEMPAERGSPGTAAHLAGWGVEAGL